MPSVTTFEIKLERTNATYNAGEIVSGMVILDVGKELKFRELTLKFVGKANTYWTEDSSTTDSEGHTTTDSTTFSQNEIYFTSCETLLGGRISEVILPVGLITFPFNVQLPHDIPSSFKHNTGYVKYEAEAVIDRPYRFNKKCKTVFNVVTPLDLNNIPEARIGINDEIYKEYTNFCCCFAGVARIQVIVSRGGYVCGDPINVKVNFDMQSQSVDINTVKVELVQKFIFHANSRTRSSYKTLAKTRDDGPFDKFSEVDLSLVIPPLDTPHLNYCTIIELINQLKVVVVVSGCHLNTTKSYPIVIGTIPVRSQSTISGIGVMNSDKPDILESNETGDSDVNRPHSVNPMKNWVIQKNSSIENPSETTAENLPAHPPSYDEIIPNPR